MPDDAPARVVDNSPTLATVLNALVELEDVLIASLELSARYDNARRPYLRFRSRELEGELHDVFHQLELLSSGWEPTNHANR